MERKGFCEKCERITAHRFGMLVSRCQICNHVKAHSSRGIEVGPVHDCCREYIERATGKRVMGSGNETGWYTSRQVKRVVNWCQGKRDCLWWLEQEERGRA